MELSPREQELLARLEDELAGDHGLAEASDAEPAGDLRRPPRLATWLGLTGLLAVGLLAVILVNVLVPDLGAIGFSVLTVAVVVPWTVFALTRLRRRGTGD